MLFSSARAFALVMFLSTAAPLAAQTAATAPPEIEVVPFLRNMSRFESWSFFEPPAESVDGSYWLLSNRATLGVRVTSPRLEVQGAFQYAQVFGLPRRATGPGPLGPGAMYYAAARTPAALQLYFKELSLRVKDLMPGLAAKIGRMGYRSGLEAPSASPALDAIKRDRLDGLLVGEVEWSIFERAFDGVRIDVDRPRWHTTAAVLWPTQGGFEESANATMEKVRIALGSFTAMSGPASLQAPAPGRASELQLFTLHYRDTRDIAVRPDNTGLETPTADVSVATIGASHVGTYSAGPGRADTSLWFAGQRGDWYGEDHRAFSVMAEGGYQWPSPWRPWVRAGLQHASGDRDPADDRHGTFFPMLPSTRPNLFAGTFAQMNFRSVFTQLRLEPHARVTLRADVHRMSLARARDRWYAGTGATARRGNFFGYVGRPSFGATRLGTLLQVSAEGVVSKRWTVKGSIGTVKGGAVVRGLFAGDRLTVFALESAVTF